MLKYKNSKKCCRKAISAERSSALNIIINSFLGDQKSSKRHPEAAINLETVESVQRMSIQNFVNCVTRFNRCN